MGVGRDMGWYRYTDNDAGTKSVLIAKHYGDNAALGFGAFNTADPVIPRAQIRIMYAVDPASGARVEVPVGSRTSTAWTGAVTAINIPRQGSAAAVSYNLQGRREEKIKKSFAMRNV